MKDVELKLAVTALRERIEELENKDFDAAQVSDLVTLERELHQIGRRALSLSTAAKYREVNRGNGTIEYESRWRATGSEAMGTESVLPT